MAEKILKDMTLNDFMAIVTERWSQLDNIKSEYLNDAGSAAKEAYKSVIWYGAFHQTIESLAEDEDFQNLSSIPDKDPEYYRVLRGINRGIAAILKAKEEYKSDRV